MFAADAAFASISRMKDYELTLRARYIFSRRHFSMRTYRDFDIISRHRIDVIGAPLAFRRHDECGA